MTVVLSEAEAGLLVGSSAGLGFALKWAETRFWKWRRSHLEENNAE